MSNIVKTEGQVSMSLFDPNYLIALDSLSERFALSDMVPDFYKAGAKVGNVVNTPEKAKANCFIALNMAMRLNADPLMVMQNMKPIMGAPSLSAQFIIALINNSGIWDELEFDFVDKGELKEVQYIEYVWNGKEKAPTTKKIGPVQNLSCVCKTRKKGGTKDLVGPEVNIEIAIKEGWYTKNGSKWPNMTRLMLMYRCATQWKSIYAPHITMGLPSTEEMVDIRPIEEADYQDIRSKVKDAAQGRKTVKVEPVAAEREPETVKTEPVQEKAQEPAPAKDETPAYANDDLDKAAEEEEDDDDDDIARIEH